MVVLIATFSSENGISIDIAHFCEKKRGSANCMVLQQCHLFCPSVCPPDMVAWRLLTASSSCSSGTRPSQLSAPTQNGHREPTSRLPHLKPRQAEEGRIRSTAFVGIIHLFLNGLILKHFCCRKAGNSKPWALLGVTEDNSNEWSPDKAAVALFGCFLVFKLAPAGPGWPFGSSVVRK